ncbi:hypothetical protein QUC31_011789 [Theobroma cacao]|uniref:Uncharacterized protein n=1 Tax=Theobroma cacao TaxID=3641 RepID=A0A061G8Q7_THECC|nr:Uncharacterized protein TCM_027163 [Theobroma cacao]WRX26883.1 hypothetical protein QQP08_019370 [Theobroma cacao]
MVMATAFSHRSSFTYFNSKSFNPDSLRPLIVTPFHPHRPCLPVRLRSSSNTSQPRCHSAGPGPASSPDSDPPRPPGFAGKLSRFQDRAQIFLAVLFWMSLFFWASAWDRNNSGRPDKGSRFRR